MRKIPGMLLALMLLLCNVTAYADKARGISTSADETFHMGHLYRHLNDVTCRVTGNYIKVRTDAKSNAKLVGHLEQADEFVLLELDGDFARVRVLNAHETSPDSWNGMEGWVTAAYVDCTCSETEYREGSGVVGRLSGEYFPIGMPSAWYFCSGAGAWCTEMTICEDGSFIGYYSDWDSGDSDAYPRGELQECRFSGRL